MLIRNLQSQQVQESEPTVRQMAVKAHSLKVEEEEEEDASDEDQESTPKSRKKAALTGDKKRMKELLKASGLKKSEVCSLCAGLA